MSHSTNPFSGDQFRRVESFALGAVLVFGFLVAAVLQQGDEDRGVGDECREEDVEGGEEGAQGLCEVSVYDYGHCVGSESDAEEWESEAGDDGRLSIFLLVMARTWEIKKGGGREGSCTFFAGVGI